MSRVIRRDFGKTLGAATLAALARPWSPSFAIARQAAKIVIVGGGAGGATVALALKRNAPLLDITLIETNRHYSTSFFSNLYLGGLRSLESLSHGYDGLQALGINVVFDRAVDVDRDRRIVKVRGGHTFAYDRLVLSPGIDIKYDAIAGYSRELSATFPQAYTTDAAQKLLLKRQLEAMRDGGVVIMAMPGNPYRCPPGPYERACMIAYYLKTRKPRSKLVILDPKSVFAMRFAFIEAFEKYYPGIVELHLTSELDDFTPVRLDPRTSEMETRNGRKWKGDVINVIAPSQAGEIGFRAGCVEGDWCPIRPENFASTRSPNIFVIGDASVAQPMPKSASAANSQAKVVAGDIIADLMDGARVPPVYHNTCWSLVAPNDLIKVGANYTMVADELTESGVYDSQKGESADLRKRNYAESVAWYSAIIADMFAKTLPAEPA